MTCVYELFFVRRVEKSIGFNEIVFVFPAETVLHMIDSTSVDSLRIYLYLHVPYRVVARTREK